MTDRVLAAMDAAARDHRCPWHARGDHLHLSRNVAPGDAYRGINIVALWAAGMLHDYQSGTVGTWREWAAAGVEVMQDARPTVILACDRFRTDGPAPRFAIRHEAVYFVEQTDAYSPFFLDDPLCTTEIIAAGERYLAHTGARLAFGGGRTFYDPRHDTIHLPPRGSFRDTGAMRGVHAFYAAAFHELGHWSGATTRLNRTFVQRFGDTAPAAEELVADLFAAFECARFGIANPARRDHAGHIGSWWRLLQADSRALFTVAASAALAVCYVEALRPGRAVAGHDTSVRRAPAPIRPYE